MFCITVLTLGTVLFLNQCNSSQTEHARPPDQTKTTRMTTKTFQYPVICELLWNFSVTLAGIKKSCSSVIHVAQKHIYHTLLDWNYTHAPELNIILTHSGFVSSWRRKLWTQAGFSKTGVTYNNSVIQHGSEFFPLYVHYSLFLPSPFLLGLTWLKAFIWKWWNIWLSSGLIGSPRRRCLLEAACLAVFVWHCNFTKEKFHFRSMSKYNQI